MESRTFWVMLRLSKKKNDREVGKYIIFRSKAGNS